MVLILKMMFLQNICIAFPQKVQVVMNCLQFTSGKRYLNNVKGLLFSLTLLLLRFGMAAQNPIIPNKGANDPHIRIIDNKAYLAASHDKSKENTSFIMEDWWLWSSEDLVSWKLECILKPQDTYIGNPFQGCWATDIAKRNGKYYWYFSERNQQAGVMVADTPNGPWKDPLGKPLLSAELTPTHEYDMGIFEDVDGEFYIVFGVWDFYIAKLNEDMVSLAEKPRKINIDNPRGPYNQDGLNTDQPTDDKPFIHFYNGKYYLSWGCFYAMADQVYGPYNYVGSIIENESFAKGYEAPTWPNGFKQGRHGSFFEWHNQWYFTYCDISQTGNRYFRDSFISYLHYRKNGEMAPIRVDGVGVGQYDANNGRIEAEDYTKAQDIAKVELANGGFAIGEIDNNDFLYFPNIKGLNGKDKIDFRIRTQHEAQILVYENSPVGQLLTRCTLSKTNGDLFETKVCTIPSLENNANLFILFKGQSANLVQLDAFTIR